LPVETRGTVQMRGASGRGAPVMARAEGQRLVLTAGDEVIGDWEIGRIGIQVLNDGFAIKTGGEEMILRTDDDAALAEELGIVAMSPRLARKVAASHPPAERVEPPQPEPVKSDLGAIVFALAGVLVLVGGFFLRQDPNLSAVGQGVGAGFGPDGRFWAAFVLVGAFMAAIGWFMTLDAKWPRVAAVVSVLAVVVVFGLAAGKAAAESDQLLSYGFIAGGIVAGVAVIFSENLTEGP
jgi:hypothetical protein